MKRPDSETLKQLAIYAAQNKLTATEAELALLKPLTKLGFRFQEPLAFTSIRGKKWFIIADFHHPVKHLIVEVDGSSHKKKKGRDSRRDRAAEWSGMKTIRVSNKEALAGTALPKIKEAMKEIR